MLTSLFLLEKVNGVRRRLAAAIVAHLAEGSVKMIT
jgi:hypothetical protein